MKTAIGNGSSALRTLKSQLSYQWRSSVLPAFFRWWRAELIACLPKQWREVLEPSNREVLLYWRADGSWNPQGIEATLPTLPAQERQRRHVLILPRDQILLIPVQLPMAASPDAEAALAFEMDKYTPFKSSDVYFDKVHVPNGSKRQDHLDLQLIVVLRERLDAVLDSASQAGHRIDAVDALNDQGQRLNINLLPAQRRPANTHPTQRLHQIVAGLSVVLLVSIMLLWVHNRQSALEEMSRQVKALRTDTQQTQALQQQLTGLLDAGRFVEDQKAQALSKAALLHELSTCIPANTWLEQLDINQQGTVSLSGQSSQAGELIGKMKACTRLESLQFQGIIQPDSSTGLDRFSLTAQLRIKDDLHASAPDSP